MKKISIAILIIFLFSILTACSTGKASDLTVASGDNGNYTGFQNLPAGLTADQAVKDGCYVSVDGAVYGGADIWQDFLLATEKGSDSNIRIAAFYDSDVYYQDLYFIKGIYSLYDSENLNESSFNYLVKLNGKTPNAVRGGTMTILTDDLTLTFEQIMSAMLSSQFGALDKLSPFKIIYLH